MKNLYSQSFNLRKGIFTSEPPSKVVFPKVLQSCLCFSLLFMESVN